MVVVISAYDLSRLYSLISCIEVFAKRIVIYNKTHEKIDTKYDIVERPNVGYNMDTITHFCANNLINDKDKYLFIKSNIYPRHIEKHELLQILSNEQFDGPIFGEVANSKNAFVFSGWYWEKNTKWYLRGHRIKGWKNPDELLKQLGYQVLDWLPFSPGGNYLVGGEKINRLDKRSYRLLNQYVSRKELGREAHILERSLGLLWYGDQAVKQLRELPQGFSYSFYIIEKLKDALRYILVF